MATARDGDRVFYLFVTNETGFSQDVTPDFLSSWIVHWLKAHNIFEDMFESDPILHCLKNKTFFVWDGNHRLLAWKTYFDRVHKDDYSRYVHVDSVILDPKDKV